METVDSNPCLNDCGKPAAVGPGRTGKFCGRSCAASFNNKAYPKRRLKNKCRICRQYITSNKIYCSRDCWSNAQRGGVRVRKIAPDTGSVTYEIQPMGDCTLGTLRQKAVRDAQVYNRLRQVSRRIAISMDLTSCMLCGYDTFFEVCHLQALSSLADDIKVTDAIGPQNFIVLCRNHHWEFDHGALALSDIPAPHLGIEPS